MKKAMCLVLLFAAISLVTGQSRFVAKTTRANLELAGISQSRDVMTDWQAFEVKDTASLKHLRDAGIYVEMDQQRHITSSPDDSLFAQQWGMTANNRSWKGDFRDAWTITQGDSTIKIGIIDCGSPWKNGVWTHPDLDSARCFAATNFVSSTVDSDMTVTDYSGHGTHVAGIISAIKNNHIGVAGIDQHAQIGFYKAFTMGGYGYDSDIANAIYRAVHDGCRVLSMSFGGDNYSRVLEDAMYYASVHGAISVIATGNSGAEVESYPSFFGRFSTRSGYRAGFPGIVAVGALNQNGTIAGYSNRGWFVDIFAPGGSGVYPWNDPGNILSTFPTYSSVLGQGDSTWYYYGDSLIVISRTSEQRTYGYLAGTSMATPFVTGTVALMLAVNHNLTSSQVKQGLLGSADSIVTAAGAIPVLNPYGAILLAKSGTILAAERIASMPRQFSLSQNYPNPFNPSTRIEFSLPELSFATLRVFNMLGQEVALLVNGQTEAGKHTIEWNAGSLPSGVYIGELVSGSARSVTKMMLMK